MPVTEFHRLLGDTPQQDTNLRHGELIVAVELPRSNFAKNSDYLKVRHRGSYAFALVAVAVALELDGSTIKQTRVVLWSVAHKPWRSLCMKYEIPLMLKQGGGAIVNKASRDSLGLPYCCPIPNSFGFTVAKVSDHQGTGRRIGSLVVLNRPHRTQPSYAQENLCFAEGFSH
jgi:CO dehydrogenase flavoprotein C-terminal domain